MMLSKFFPFRSRKRFSWPINDSIKGAPFFRKNYFSSSYQISGKTLLINDRAYGEFEINDEQVLRIFQTKIFQKMLKITQHGVPGLIGWSQPVSRGEHMIGAYLLVRKLTNNKEEQYAALIHDITHRTFSHLIDIVFRESLQGQSLHELDVLEFIKNTDLARGIEPPLHIEKLLDLKKYTILEQNSPALCADRGDYSPRDLIATGLAEKRFTTEYFNQLGVTQDGKMFLKSAEFAREFALKCIDLDKAFYGSVRNIGLNHLAAKLIRRGLEQNIIKKEDFDNKTCWEVWDRLKSSTDESLLGHFKIIKKELHLIKNKDPRSQFILKLKNQESNREADSQGCFLVAENVKCKPRFIDPLVEVNGSFGNLSLHDSVFAKAFQAHREERTKTVNVYCRNVEI